MTKHETIVAGVEALAKLREPFPEHQISKLPKPTKKQTEEVRADFKKGVRCKVCESWHHPDVIHLDYVGHAAATDRLLDTDLEWTWEPLAVDQRGLPVFDENGGLWIKLTVCGVTRLGYGSADGKSGGDAKKEIIGDAIRNAGIRFGMALDLWHKGNLHLDEGEETAATPATVNPEQELVLEDKMREAGVDKVKFIARAGAKLTKEVPAEKFAAMMKALNDIIAKAEKAKAEASPRTQVDDDLADEVPY